MQSIMRTVMDDDGLAVDSLVLTRSGYGWFRAFVGHWKICCIKEYSYIAASKPFCSKCNI